MPSLSPSFTHTGDMASSRRSGSWSGEPLPKVFCVQRSDQDKIRLPLDCHCWDVSDAVRAGLVGVLVNVAFPHCRSDPLGRVGDLGSVWSPDRFGPGSDEMGEHVRHGHTLPAAEVIHTP